MAEETPCNWLEGKDRGGKAVICGKISAPGKNLCPRHDAMRVAKLQKELDKSSQARRPSRARKKVQA